jgi:quercetin dioxygenase-like cupin family protein
LKTLKLDEAPLRDTVHGIEARLLYDEVSAQAIQLRLKPGESLRRHITPTDVFFLVLEGTGVVEVGDEKQEVSANTLIDSPAGIPHCWYNESDDILRVLVVKAPRPTAAAKLL